MSIPARSFRAHHVGSLPRPEALKEAHEKARRGSIDPDELRAAEDDAIRAGLAPPEAAGLSAVTDGELRRTMWHRNPSRWRIPVSARNAASPAVTTATASTRTS